MMPSLGARQAILVTLALCGSLALGCRSGPQRIVVGYNLPPWGDDIINVVRDEMAEWRASGLPDIRIVKGSSTTGGPADADVASAENLVSHDGIVGVVGHGGSRESLVAAPIYNDAGVIQIVPTGTSRLLRQAGPWTFPLPPDDSLEGQFIADHVVRRLGARRVMILYRDDEYGDGLRDGVVKALKNAEAEVVEELPVFGSSEIEPLIVAALRHVTPDCVVLATRAATAGRIARVITSLVPGIPIVAGDGAFSLSQLVQSAGPAIDGMHLVSFWLPDPTDPRSQRFVDRFRRVTGNDQPLFAHALAYDATMVLVHAVTEVGNDPEAVRRYLSELGGRRPPYRGVTGEITFSRDRPPRFVMVRVEDQRLVRVDEP
jgi:branched-chain amino acid transport system substrate-binding protein